MTGAALWRWSELRAAVGAGPDDRLADGPEVTGISIDSRTLAPGDLFVALSGAPDPRYRGAAGQGRDGHDFVAAAAAAGAAAALVARPTGAGLPELVVSDPFEALWGLARTARTRYGGPVFALTGSSGKTTAKEMLAAALAPMSGSVHASAGSFNNHIGVPLSLARLPADAGAAVFELGMNTPGEIAPLAELVRPNVGLVLNVLGVHLEGLGSLEAIRREKLSITGGLTAEGPSAAAPGPGGLLVVHDEVHLADLPANLQRVTFGRTADADVRLIDDGLGQTRDHVEIRLPDGTVLETPRLADGPHRRLSACAVVACLVAADLDAAVSLSILEGVEPPPGRGGALEAGGVRIIDDSYNANPESVRQAVAGLLERPAGRRWALLGDMLELGVDEAALHAGLAPACEGLDGVFCVGPLMRHLHEALPAPLRAGWWPDCDAFDVEAVRARVAPGDALLVKASNRLFWKHKTLQTLTDALGAGTAPPADTPSPRRP